MQRAPLTQLTDTVNKDLRGSRKRTGNAKKRGAQLEPKRFTEFMSNVGNVQAAEEMPQYSGFEERKIPSDLETLIVKAITEMDANKAVGSDGIHFEMLRANKKATAKALKELGKQSDERPYYPGTG